MGKRNRSPKPQQAVAPDRAAAPIVRQYYWIIPLALFLVVRLFSADPYYLLGGDQCTFLELGRTFPKHQLFGHQLYLIHPPLFGYAIGLFQLFLPLLTSGLVATLLFAVGAFLAVRNLGALENLSPAAILTGLTYLALSRPAVSYDIHVARVSLLVCTTALAFLAFLHMLREPSRKTMAWAIAANCACVMLSEQALLLLPCEAAIVWARGSIRQWRWVVPLAVSVAVAIVWPLVRLVEFVKHDHLPAGIDGTIEFTRNFPLLALIQPNYLPFTNAHRSLFTQTSLSLWNIDPVLLLKLPADLLLIPAPIGAVLVILLIVAAVARTESRRRSVVWLVLSLLFLLPVGMGMNEWYGMGFIVPFSLLMMEGASAGIARAGSLVKNPEWTVTAGISLTSLVAVAIWLGAPPPGPHAFLTPVGGTHFLFARPPVTRAASISNYFASMPRDTGIMVPQGLSPEVSYLTGKRVVAIPFDPELLDRFIEEYHISYLLTSSEYLQRLAPPKADRYTSRLVTAFILQNPARYRLVSSLHEEYPAFYPPLDYFILQVQPRP